MIRLAGLVVFGLAASSVLAAPPASLPGRASKAPPFATPCDVNSERGVCLFGGQRLVGKVQLAEAVPASRKYRLSVAVNGETAGIPAVAVTTEEGRTIALKPGTLTRRASVELETGELGEKGILTVGLKLEGEGGKLQCAGTATLALGHRQYDAPFVGGETNCDLVRSVQAYPTEKPGRWAIAFTATGDAAASIVGGAVWTQTVGKDGRPVTATAPLASTSFATEREYLAEVRFDGDPVGSSYELDVVIGDGARPLEHAKTTLDVGQLPGGEGTPGIVYGVAGNGCGTKNACSSASTKPQLL